MKRTKFTEGQIVTILKGAKAGIAVTELSRKYGFSQSIHIFKVRRADKLLGI